MYKIDSANTWKDNSKKQHLLTYTRIGEDDIGHNICYIDWQSDNKQGCINFTSYYANHVPTCRNITITSLISNLGLSELKVYKCLATKIKKFIISDSKNSDIQNSLKDNIQK